MTVRAKDVTLSDLRVDRLILREIHRRSREIEYFCGRVAMMELKHYGVSLAAYVARLPGQGFSNVFSNFLLPASLPFGDFHLVALKARSLSEFLLLFILVWHEPSSIIAGDIEPTKSGEGGRIRTCDPGFGDRSFRPLSYTDMAFPLGLEPRTSRFEAGCAIHCATGRSGAGCRNRTRICTLQGGCSAIELNRRCSGWDRTSDLCLMRTQLYR